MLLRYVFRVKACAFVICFSLSLSVATSANRAFVSAFDESRRGIPFVNCPKRKRDNGPLLLSLNVANEGTLLLLDDAKGCCLAFGGAKMCDPLGERGVLNETAECRARRGEFALETREYACQWFGRWCDGVLAGRVCRVV